MFSYTSLKLIQIQLDLSSIPKGRIRIRKSLDPQPYNLQTKKIVFFHNLKFKVNFNVT